MPPRLAPADMAIRPPQLPIRAPIRGADIVGPSEGDDPEQRVFLALAPIRSRKSSETAAPPATATGPTAADPKLQPQTPPKTRPVKPQANASPMAKRQPLPAAVKAATKDAKPMPEEKRRANHRNAVSEGVARGSVISRYEHEVSTVQKRTPEEISRLEKMLTGSFFFDSLPDEKRLGVFNMLAEVVTNPGETVIEQGAIDTVMYFVEDGEYAAYLKQVGDNNTPVAHYSAGGFFGELAMMFGAPRAASIRCSASGHLWAMRRNVWKSSFEETVSLKMDSKLQFLRTVELLSPLSEAEREALADLFEETTYEQGQRMWKAGEPAESLILIKTGTVAVIEPEPEAERRTSVGGDDGDARRRSFARRRSLSGMQVHLKQGDFFGTQSMADLGAAEAPTRRVTGMAMTDVVTYKLSRTDALKLGDLPQLIFNTSAVKARRNVDWFTALHPTEKLVAVQMLIRKGYAHGDAVLSAGCTDKVLFVVVTGKVMAESQLGGQVHATRFDFTAGDHFNERSLIEHQASRLTYTAESACTCVAISRANLRELSDHFADNPELLQPQQNAFQYDWNTLQLRSTLGSGAFGCVRLVYHAPSQKFYALKCMKKGLIIAKGETEHILHERRLMGICRHPFIVHLVATLQDETQLYMLMDLVQGGELFTMLDNEGTLDEPSATFYAANVTCALEYLHHHNIAYRDLKPENLMIDKEGYLKVVDFGFAKVVEDRTFTVCGTPEYLAPETIRRKGHTLAVDWWALGILLYELLTGRTPFEGRGGGSQMDMFARIVQGQVPRDRSITKGAWALITALLLTDEDQRLGSRVRGQRSVREHAFFADRLDMEALERRTIAAPWVPPITSAADLSHFEGQGAGPGGADDLKAWEDFRKSQPEAFISW